MAATSPSPSAKNNMYDVASMFAARDASPRAAAGAGPAPPPPLASRDGFDLISREPITWDHDCTITQDNYVLEDITYHKSTIDMSARIAFNRPDRLHAFRPKTIREIQIALSDATDDPDVAVIVLTSNTTSGNIASTTSSNDHHHTYTLAFCAGGDQTVRASTGYQDGTESVPKLRVLDLQIQMRRCPKPIVAVVRGYAVGGGHILHMVADLTLADETAVFGQTGPRMGSFDAGYGCVQAAHLIGQKRARELWFLCRFYTAQEALLMGLINAVYPPNELEGRLAQWVRRMVMNSPTAIACCKAALNASQDGAAGIAQMGGELTRLYYMSKESQEGQQAFLEKRAPRFRSRL